MGKKTNTPTFLLCKQAGFWSQPVRMLGIRDFFCTGQFLLSELFLVLVFISETKSSRG